MKRGFLSVSVCVALLAFPATARAEPCVGNPDALGTSRTVFLDTSKGFEAGRQYGRSLPLADKEVVLTFDDGPLPAVSEKVRAALKAECVQATFFLVGRNALTYPAFVRQLAADGHSLGTHTWSHDMHMPEKPLKEGMSQINRGIAALNVALKTSAAQTEAAPFFRFPGLNSDRAMRDILKDRGVGVFDIDIEGADWVRGRTPAQVFHRVREQLEKKRRGIVLLHDIHPRTAAMLPEFLRFLKKEGYRVVHLAPKPEEPKIADASATPFQASHETTGAVAAWSADDLIANKAETKKSVLAKAPASGEKLQKMATAAPEKAISSPQVSMPKHARVAPLLNAEPFRPRIAPSATRYADARQLRLVPQQPQRRGRRYLLNELFGIHTN
jgi:peptidoglycan/xylan/chitin deacetylase (PgdA/CDA1 family)